MLLTVFTATYNRSHLLDKLYESLCNQKYFDFEWLIIDDSSTDNTFEKIKEWSENSLFKIRYLVQEHGGKHRALNKGFQLADGEYFFIVDSDDYITNDAIGVVYHWIESTKSNHAIAGFSGLKINKKDGRIIGGQTDSDGWIDASNLERKSKNLLGDKAEIYKTSILRQFPFPEFEGEFFATEAICWNRIAAAGYKLRWYMKGIYVCEYLDGGLTNSGANELKGKIDNYFGYSCYVRDLIQFCGLTSNPIELNRFIKVAKIRKRTKKDIATDLTISKLNTYLLRGYISLGLIKGGLRKLR